MYSHQESLNMQQNFNNNLENAKKLIDQAIDNFEDTNYEVSKQLRKEYESIKQTNEVDIKDAEILWELLTDNQKIHIVKNGLPILVKLCSKIDVFSSGVTKQGDIFFGFRFNNQQVYYERRCTVSEIQDILKL